MNPSDTSFYLSTAFHWHRKYPVYSVAFRLLHVLTCQYCITFEHFRYQFWFVYWPSGSEPSGSRLPFGFHPIPSLTNLKLPRLILALYDVFIAGLLIYFAMVFILPERAANPTAEPSSIQAWEWRDLDTIMAVAELHNQLIQENIKITK